MLKDLSPVLIYDTLTRLTSKGTTMLRVFILIGMLWGCVTQPLFAADEKTTAAPTVPSAEGASKSDSKQTGDEPKRESPATWLDTYKKETQKKAATTTASNTTKPVQQTAQPQPQPQVEPIDPSVLIQEQAFRQVEQQAFPMTSEQIKALRRRLDETQRAASTLPGTPPKPVSTSLVVNLSPGATPPNIRLAKGFVSSLVFLDATGAQWPIQSYDLGNPDDINIKFDKNIPNTLFVQSMREYAFGNIAVNLEALKTPVMITLVPGQREIDYRVDVRVQSLSANPNRNLLSDGMPDKANTALLNLLNGVPPENSQQLKVDGAYSQAWLAGNRLWFRTRFKVLSPSPIGSMVSGDGTMAYELPKTSMVLVSKHGKVVQMAIEGSA